MHVINVMASLGLIFGYLGFPPWGLPAPAPATTSRCLPDSRCGPGPVLRHARPSGFLAGLPRRFTFLTTLRLAGPHSFQQLWFAAGYAVLFWILGQVGTSSVAVGHVLVNLSLLLILPGVGLGMAAMSLVGQALGREEHGDAHRWGWEVVHLAWLCLAVIALPMALFPDAVLALFLHDPTLVELASAACRLTALMIVLDAAALVLAQALLGAGANRTVMTATLSLQWLLFLPLAWLSRRLVRAGAGGHLVDTARLSLPQLAVVRGNLAASSLAAPLRLVRLITLSIKTISFNSFK